MEPEALVQCPYDRSHRVRVSRLPYHLVRCEQNNPQASRGLATCPFNARHRVPRGHLRGHLSSCPDRRLLDAPQDTEGSTLGAPPEPPRAWQPPPCREYWDAELDALEEPPPFILNVTRLDLPVPRDRSSPAAPPRAGGVSGPPEGPSRRGPRAVTAGTEPCPDPLGPPQDPGGRRSRGGIPGRGGEGWWDRRGGDCPPSF